MLVIVPLVLSACASPPVTPAQLQPLPEEKVELQAAAQTSSQTSRNASPADMPEQQLVAEEPLAPIGNAAMTEREQVMLLEQQLNRQLGKFDEEMLQERERVQNTENEQGGGSYGGGGSSNGGASTGSNGDANSVGESQDSAQSAKPGGGQSRTPRTGQRAGQVADGQTGDMGAARTAVEIPKNLPDGRDDDVVARQLREAATQETDPVLREKLWDEYRKYRTGTQAR